MKKFLKKFLAGFVFLSLFTQTAFAQVSNPNYFKKVGNAINFTSSAYTFGSVGTPVNTAFFDDITISGTCTGCSGGSGDVVGPASSTDNALVRFDSTTGKLVQNGVGILGDTGDLSGLLRTAAGSGGVLGGSTSAEAVWDHEHTITDFSASTAWSPFLNYVTLNPSSNIATTSILGADFQTNVLAANIRDIQKVEGVYTQAVHNGTGTVATLAGGELYAWTSSSGPVTNLNGLIVSSFAETTSTSAVTTNIGLQVKTGHAGTVSGSITTDTSLLIKTPYFARTLTTHKGIDIEDQGFGTSSWAIYSAGGKVEFSAATSTSADFQVSGVDITHGLTTIAPTNSFYRLAPISGTAGGASVTAISDANAQPYKVTAIFGSASPTVTTPAIEQVAAKTNGTTGQTALASTEMAYKLSNNTTQLMKVMGDGRMLLGSGTTASYPLHITNAPIGGTVIGVVPATVATNDILFYLSSPANTGNITAISLTGPIDGDLIGVVSNTNSSSASARAYYESRVNGASSGDPAYLYTISGVVNWISGIDNSNADSYSISAGSNLGTNDVLTLTRTPFLVGINKNVPTSTLDVVQTAATSGSPVSLTVTSGSHTTLTASTEVTDVNFNNARTIGISAGALTTNRTVRFQPPTFAFVSASTLSNAINVDIGGAPTSGNGSTTITNPTSLRVGGAATYLSNASLSYKNVLLASHTVTLSGTTTVTSTNPQSQLNIGTLTLTDASTITVDKASSLYIVGPVAQAGSLTIVDSYSAWIDSGSVRMDGRVLTQAGANIAAAATLTLGSDGIYFTITGNTNVDYITTTGYTAGSIVYLYFTGTPTLNHNTGSVPANTAALQLSGSTNATIGAADAVISFIYNGTSWQEVSRVLF